MPVRAGIALLAVLALAFALGRILFPPTPGEYDSRVPAVPVTVRAPQYVAAVPGGLVARAGDRSVRIRGGSAAVWLDDGRLLAMVDAPCAGHFACPLPGPAVWDPASGRIALVPALGDGRVSLPDEAVTRVAVTRANTLLSLSPDLSEKVALVPPQPTEHGVRRTFGDGSVAIGSWVLVPFGDVDASGETSEYGYLRTRIVDGHQDGGWSTVLLGQRIVGLYVSRDGRSLLGVQQLRGEPCGQCTVRQRIVEIDPATGEVAASYGTPPGYDETWRVGDVDKVGHRVLVRYVHRSHAPFDLGVWRYDGSWSLVPGSDRAFTWWQGPTDRIEAVPAGGAVPDDRGSYRLVWVHGSTRTALPGTVTGQDVAGWRGAPGTLAPTG